MDNGSLTAQEYEEIYFVLKEYVHISTLDKPEPFYVTDVRRVKAQTRVKPLITKMEARMKQFPNSFCA